MFCCSPSGAVIVTADLGPRIEVSDVLWRAWADTALHGRMRYDALHCHEDRPATGEESDAYMLAQEVEGLRAAFPEIAGTVLGGLYELLFRWYDWWRHNDSLPPRLPGELHVDTATALITANLVLGRTFPVGDLRASEADVAGVEPPSMIKIQCVDCQEYRLPEDGKFVAILGTGFVCVDCKTVRLNG